MKTVDELLAASEAAMTMAEDDTLSWELRQVSAMRAQTLVMQANVVSKVRGDKARVLEELRKKLSEGSRGYMDNSYPYRNVIETPTGFRVFIEYMKNNYENGQIVSRLLYPANPVLDIVRPFQQVGWDIDVKRFDYGSPGYVVCHSHYSDTDTTYLITHQICNKCLEVLPLVLPRKPEPEQDPG